MQGIREVLAAEHGLRPHAICLLTPASLPKTSSGKVRRRACQAAYLNGTLKARHLWVAGPVESSFRATGPPERRSWAR